jgi:hypothetical protein
MSAMPSIPQAAFQAWRDVGRVFRELPGAALIALAVMVLVGAAQELLAPAPDDLGSSGFDLVAAIAAMLAQTFLITPYLIAVHRLIILNERAAHYALTPGEPRFRRFFVWSLAMSLAVLIPFLIALLLTHSPGARAIVMLVCAIALVYVTLRIILLFPAIAVDAPGATWANAWADSKGSAGRILLMLLLAALPIIVALFLLTLVISVSAVMAGGLTAQRLVFAAAMAGAGGMVGYTLVVVIASRLYEWLADRLKQPS